MKDRIWLKTRDAFWFLPSVYSLFSIISVLLIVFTDQYIIDQFKEDIPSILLTKKDVAIEIYASLVTAILTMTTISFSVIMVVLTTYSNQFSPRTLQDFMRDRTTQHVLGVYCFGFIFALLNLLIVGKENIFLGPVFMTIIAIIELAFFVYFIHHSANWMQVNNLIRWIEIDGAKIIKKNIKKQQNFHIADKVNQDELNFRKKQQKNLKVKKSGYVQDLKWNKLVEWLEKNNAVAEMRVEVGDFIQKDLKLISIYSDNKLDSYEALYEYIVIGNERTDLQDVEFTIQKLVEIALRAISPAVNDPHTAINAMYRIGSLLIELGTINDKGKYITDKNEHLRVIKRIKTFPDYLFKSFYQIRNYGKNDISIMYSILEVLNNVAMASNTKIRKEIWEFHFYIIEAIDWDGLPDQERNYLQSIYEKLKTCCSGNDAEKSG
ncbi:Uncharacterized membrane protein [Gracilibacillus ureilyticus]|uniref:Uncharacterized membrane protein n=1 Tax=Gracilibacillus ureilyticus TaxID=531814 RepID=A0A1H9L163_9BACI|nr:DUF2254 domain-containing protein [Gracilibacillus ureilyticus]SER04877.1 Uncharacterized membrane protein [Gracilibacillus ureilyticus]